MNTIGIFQGKQKTHNIQALTILFDNGPLSVWEITRKIQETNRHSLHATLNKSLRLLEKKGYIHRENRKWILDLKGLIAVLIIQPKTKMWNAKWKARFDEHAKIIEKCSKEMNAKIILKGVEINTSKVLKWSGKCADEFDNWVNLAKTVKTLIENGINLDRIKQEALMGLVILQNANYQELATLYEQNNERKANGEL